MENRFKWAREKIKQINVQTVAKELEIPRSLIDEIELDSPKKRGVSYLTVKKLADYYGVSMDWLCGACAFDDWSLKDYRKEREIRMATRKETRQEIFGWADDILAEQNLFQLLADECPSAPRSNGEPVDMWYEGADEILCRTEDIADALADWLDEHGYCSTTGYYDPEEDEREGCVGQQTGWYYVTV